MEAAGGAGLRAFCSIPSGVEEELMGVEVWGSGVDRREGIRGVFDSDGEVVGEVSGSVETSERGLEGAAKSTDSSGAPEVRVGGVAIFRY